MEGERLGHGVLWIPSADLAVAFVVDAGRITAALPHWAGKRLIGRRAARLVEQVDVYHWAPGCEPFAPWLRYDKTPVLRWRYGGTGHGYGVHHLTLGRLGDGRWCTDDTAEKVAWSFPDEAGARADVRRRMDAAPEARWTEVEPRPRQLSTRGGQ